MGRKIKGKKQEGLKVWKQEGGRKEMVKFGGCEVEMQSYRCVSLFYMRKPDSLEKVRDIWYALLAKAFFKSEARKTKSETILKNQNSNFPNRIHAPCHEYDFIFDIGQFDIQICFGFQDSYFEFWEITIQNHALLA